MRKVDLDLGRDRDLVRRLIGKLASIRVERAILFGSRVRGDALLSSDLDLILVSPDFEGVFFTDRPMAVVDAWDFEGAPPLEVLCYTPEEFERKRARIGIVRTALEEGIAVV